MKLDKSLDNLDKFVDTLLKELRNGECKEILNSQKLITKMFHSIYDLGKSLCDLMNCDDNGCAGKEHSICIQSLLAIMNNISNKIDSIIYECKKV